MVGYNRFNRLFVIIFLVVILSFGSSVFGADWLTFKGGLTRTSLTNEIIVPPIRKVEWTINTGFPISMSPVSKGDFVYFGTEGGTTDSTFYCLLKGKKIWEFPNDKLRSFTDKRTGEKPWPNGAMDFDRTSLKISPTIYEKKVYLPWGSMLLILNYESGNLIDYLDLKDFGHTGSINTSPLIHSNHKLIICGSTNGYLYGFDIELREPLIRWRIPEGSGTGGTISSSVAYYNRQIFFGSTSKMFYSYELTYAGSDGVKAGALPTKNWEVKLDGQISQTPAVVGSRVVITTRDGYVYCLSTSTGDIIWQKNTASRIDASPVISGSYVIIVAGKNIKCFNIEDGSQKWSSALGEMCYGTPAANSQYAYVTCNDGKFYVYQLSNGFKACTKKIGSPIRSSPCVSNNRIMFGAQNGIFYALVTGDEPAKVQCSKSEIDIPIVYNDEVREYEEFFIDNVGGETLTGSVSFSRKWVTTTNSSFNISADDGEQILIRFDANGQVEGKYKIMMKVDTNGGEVNIPITVNIVKRPDTIINLMLGSQSININGQPIMIEAAPWKTDSGTVMAPLRVITEAFGCNVSWQAETRSVKLIYAKKDIEITVRIGNQVAYIEYSNGLKSPQIMPHPPEIVENRTFVPLEFISRAFDAEITNLGSGNYMIRVRHN